MSFGGGTTIQQAPTPPTVGQTAGEAIQAELQYGPQLAQQQYQLAQQYSPQYAQLQAQLLGQYGEQLGTGAYEAMRAANPYITGVEEQAAQQIGQRLGETDEELIDAYRREFSAAEAGAGRLGSPVGSFNIARQTVGAREAQRQTRLNEALALSGKTPVTSAPQAAIASPQTTSAYVSPALGFASSVYGTQGSIYNTGLQQQTAMRGQNMQLIGAGIGAVGTMGGAYLGR